MTNHARMYRFGVTPWERYGAAAAASIAALLDREERDRPSPPGRALDIGCFQGFDGDRRRAEGEGVTAIANLGATLLMLAFGPTRMRSLVGGVSETEVAAAFPGWDVLTVEPAITRGLGWPMNRTRPQWHRLRRTTG